MNVFKVVQYIVWRAAALSVFNRSGKRPTYFRTESFLESILHKLLPTVKLLYPGKGEQFCILSLGHFPLFVQTIYFLHG